MVDIKLETIPEAELLAAKGMGTKGVRNAHFAKALAEKGLISWIKEQINKSTIKIRMRSKHLADVERLAIFVLGDNMAEALGPEFQRIGFTDLEWGLQFVLFMDGIVVASKKTPKGQALIMAYAVPGDELPPSQAKYVEPSKEEIRKILSAEPEPEVK